MGYTSYIDVMSAAQGMAGPVRAVRTHRKRVEGIALLEEYVVGLDGPWGSDEAAHLWRRAGFGATPDERAHAVGAGNQASMQAAVDALVHVLPLDPHLDYSAGITDATFGDPIPDLPDNAAPGDVAADVLSRIKNPRNETDLQGSWLYRMRYTSQPLQEQFALFLHDHMVSEWDKVRNTVPGVINGGNDGSVPGMQVCTSGSLGFDLNRLTQFTVNLLKEQNALFRHTGMDGLRDLLIAITRDPCMLIYLDNAVNVKGRAQENFAREVMELFSMGVGNYSEQDIREIAKCLTGETWQHWWRNGQLSFQEACAHDYSYAYGFVPAIHEPGNKTVFGTTVSEDFSGQETLDVIDLILSKPSVQPDLSNALPAYHDLPATAVYTEWKLLRWFVNHQVQLDPPDPAVLELADYLRGSDNAPYPQRRFPYDLRAAMRKILLSKYFYDTAHRWTMYKNPAEFVVRALRGLDSAELFSLFLGPPTYMSLMGMRLFSPPNVAGWNHGTSWTTSGNVILRFQYAYRLAYFILTFTNDYGKAVLDSYLALPGSPINGHDDDEGMVEFFNQRLLDGAMDENERAALRAFLADTHALVPQANLTEIRYYLKMQALIYLVMTMPRFQLK